MTKPAMQNFQAFVKIDNLFQLGIYCNDNKLQQLSFLSLEQQNLNQQHKINASNNKINQDNQQIIEQTIEQLQLWEKNPAFKFTIPLQLSGSEFQLKVWQEISKINFAKTCSYGEIANKINNHPRAIGQACGRNPIPIIVPCHRVIGKNSLGGFNRSNGKYLLDIKTWLLEREKFS